MTSAAEREMVSVIIPTRNRQALLLRTLRTALRQDVGNLEVIVVDNGSEDGTSAALRRVGDERLRLVHHEPLGVAEARNRGLEAARGRWVAFLDDDDLWSPRKLGRQLAAIRAVPGAGWSAVGAVTVSNTWEVRRVRHPPTSDQVCRLVLASNPIPGGGSGVLADTQLVRQLGCFDPLLGMLADWDLWIRLALAADMAPVAEPLMLTVRHENNMSLDVSRSLHELHRIGEKYLDERRRLNVPSHELGMLRWIAWSEARAGRRWAAIRTYLRLAGRQPSWWVLSRMAMAALGPRALALRERQSAARIPLGPFDQAKGLICEIRAVIDEAEY
jgi:glycosyltransferase involved in cell wall biosynthesis